TSPVHRIPQRIYQLQEGISVRPNTIIHKFAPASCATTTTRLTRNIQPDDPIFLTEGDIYEFSGFFIVQNSRQRKLTQLSYYIQIDQETTMSKVTDIGPIFPSSANYNPAITYNKILLQQIN
ncbi:hypothetical protein IGI04_016758, partial [Brassica rapa subsp. trilocularis]